MSTDHVDFWISNLQMRHPYQAQYQAHYTIMATPLRQACRKAPRSIQQWQTRTFASTTPTPASQISPDPEVLPPIDMSTLPSQAHADIETHREIRSLARKAAWEMPLLTSLAKPFTPPTKAEPLRWRYTSYMGEQHPAAKKVVVEFSPRDLHQLNESQRLKLKKLVGARYNPTKDLIHMSCESFETQAQNKRHLGDTIGKLLAEATDPNADTFADVPLDLRHVTNKRSQRNQKAQERLYMRTQGFPAEWRLTERRKRYLEALRNPSPAEPAVEAIEGQTELEGGERIEAQAQAEAVETAEAVSGAEAIEKAKGINLEKTEEPIMVEARAPVPPVREDKS